MVAVTGIPSASKSGTSIAAMNASFVETNMEPTESEEFTISAVTVTVVDCPGIVYLLVPSAFIAIITFAPAPSANKASPETSPPSAIATIAGLAG